MVSCMNDRFASIVTSIQRRQLMYLALGICGAAQLRLFLDVAYLALPRPRCLTCADRRLECAGFIFS